MQTKRLQEVVDMVSSILTNYPVQTKTIPTKNTLVISTTMWDFYLVKIEKDGCYVLENTVTNNTKLSNEYIYTLNRIKREIFGRYCITNSL